LTARDQGVAVRTGYDAGAARVCVVVQDEGVGIPAEHLARIKDPFFTTKHDTGGTGLGLSVSDRIIANHGGTLTFASGLKRGATATVMLPPEARAAPRRSGAAPGRRAAGTRRRSGKGGIRTS